MNATDFPFKTVLLALRRRRGARRRWRCMPRRCPSTSGSRATGLALIIGGAAGNLIDRVTVGYVVDFVDVYWSRLAFLGVQRGRCVDYRWRRADDSRPAGSRQPTCIQSCLSIGPVTVYTYGVLLAASYLLGLQLAMRARDEWGLDAKPRARPRHLHHHRRAGRREAAAGHHRFRSVPRIARGAAVARAFRRRVLWRADHSRSASPSGTSDVTACRSGRRATCLRRALRSAT